MPEQECSLHAVVLTQLDEIKDPCSVANGTPMGLVEMGLIDSIRISDHGQVEINLRLTSPFCHMIGFFKVEATRRLKCIAGISGVIMNADMGLDWSSDRISPAAQVRRMERLPKNERARHDSNG
jgi:metal-sulfur cluster biosynthetic enzyme